MCMTGFAKTRHIRTKWQRTVTPRSVPPQIGPILSEIFVRTAWSPRTTFAAKIGPVGLILAAKTGPPLPILVPCKNVSLQQSNRLTIAN